MATFPNDHNSLRTEMKRQVYEEHRRGEPIEALASRFCQTRPLIRRIINEVRAARIMELPLDYIDNEQFARLRSERQEKDIVGSLPEGDLPPKQSRLPSGLPAYVASLYEVPLLSRAQEVYLFRKMNYLKYKAARLRAELNPRRPKSRLMDQIEHLYEDAVATKNQIIWANLRLVISIAKRHVGSVENFFELVSDGNMSLTKAVEKFDFARGFRFSTYASWAIIRNFAREIPCALRHRDRFRSGHSEMLATTEDSRMGEHDQESAQIQRKSLVARMLRLLNEREQEIVACRFGLTGGQEPMTLKQVGATMGVTKERIRQIQSRAMDKMRRAAEEANSTRRDQARALSAIHRPRPDE
jgi:RNA polymerase primary sigma factor/RNA polymerase sigma factor